MVEDDEDRISKLPDCLLVEILSHLPETKYAFRTSTLSKRWKHVWHQVPNLVFRHHPYDTDAISEFYSFVDKTLTQRPQLKLKKFEVSYDDYDPRFDSQVRNWLHYAINCNVEDLDFALWNMVCQPLFLLDHLFFMNSCFTNLALVGCMFNPTGAINWKNLRSLYITYGKLDEDAIENILSGSPVLETLVLDQCDGYRRVNITSKSVKNLVFSRYLGRDVEINAPNILSLKIGRKMNFSRLLLLDVSSLVTAELDYINYGTHLEDEMLKGFILSLRHVKDLILGPYCFNAFVQLKREGFVSPSNLKVLDRFADMFQDQIDGSSTSRSRLEDDIEQDYAITSSGLEDDDEEIDAITSSGGEESEDDADEN